MGSSGEKDVKKHLIFERKVGEKLNKKEEIL